MPYRSYIFLVPTPNDINLEPTRSLHHILPMRLMALLMRTSLRRMLQRLCLPLWSTSQTPSHLQRSWDQRTGVWGIYTCWFIHTNKLWKIHRYTLYCVYCWFYGAYNNHSVLLPGQPVVDLENYMASLEKKQQSVEKMIEKLAPLSDEHSKKWFGGK